MENGVASVSIATGEPMKAKTEPESDVLSDLLEARARRKSDANVQKSYILSFTLVQLCNIELKSAIQDLRSWRTHAKESI